MGRYQLQEIKEDFYVSTISGGVVRRLIQTWVDTNTGELQERLVGPIDKESPYEEHPYKYTGSTFNLLWVDCDTIAKANLYIDEMIDKRTLVRSNNVIRMHDIDCGNAYRAKAKPSMNNKQVGMLDKLVDNILYRNMVYVTSDEMVGILNCHKKHIRRELNSLSRTINIKESKRNEWIVEIHPVMGWVYTSDSFSLARSSAIRSWLQGGIRTQTETVLKETVENTLSSKEF